MSAEQEWAEARERVSAWLDDNWKYVSDELGRDLRTLCAVEPLVAGSHTPAEWAETLEGEVRGWFPTPEGYADPDVWAAQVTLYAAALVEREREAAKAEGMAAVAGPVLALAEEWLESWEKATEAGLAKLSHGALFGANQRIRAAIPTDAAEALARVRTDWLREVLITALGKQESPEMLSALLLDAADRLGNPHHRGNQYVWPEHARMMRALARAAAHEAGMGGGS